MLRLAAAADLDLRPRLKTPVGLLLSAVADVGLFTGKSEDFASIETSLSVFYTARYNFSLGGGLSYRSFPFGTTSASRDADAIEAVFLLRYYWQ